VQSTMNQQWTQIICRLHCTQPASPLLLLVAEARLHSAIDPRFLYTPVTSHRSRSRPWLSGGEAGVAAPEPLLRSTSANTLQCIEREPKCMRRRIEESEMGNRKRWNWIAAAGLLVAATIAILVWRSVQAQVPHSGDELVWVIDDEDWIKREKLGESGALGCRSGMRDAAALSWWYWVRGRVR